MKQFIILMTASLFFVACNNQDLQKPSDTNQISLMENIKVENGILKFVDEDHFQLTISKLSLMKDIEKMTSQIVEFDNYESNYQAYDNITVSQFSQISKSNKTSGYENILNIQRVDGSEPQIVRNITYAPLGLLVNKDGKVIIGNKIHQFFYDKVQVASYSPTRIGSVNEIYPVEHKVVFKELKNLKPSAEIKSCDQYRYSGNERRLCGIINYSLYYSPGISGKTYTTFTTEHQTRTLGFIWYTSVISTISLTGTAYVDYSPVSINMLTTNASNTNYYVPSYCSPVPGGTYCSSGIVTGSSTIHKGLGLDGNWKQTNL